MFTLFPHCFSYRLSVCMWFWFKFAHIVRRFCSFLLFPADGFRFISVCLTWLKLFTRSWKLTATPCAALFWERTEVLRFQERAVFNPLTADKSHSVWTMSPVCLQDENQIYQTDGSGLAVKRLFMLLWEEKSQQYEKENNKLSAGVTENKTLQTGIRRLFFSPKRSELMTKLHMAAEGNEKKKDLQSWRKLFFPSRLKTKKRKQQLAINLFRFIYPDSAAAVEIYSLTSLCNLHQKRNFKWAQD